MVGQNVLVYRSTPLMLPYLPYLPYLGVENVSKLSAWPSIARAITPSLRRLDVPNEPPPLLVAWGGGADVILETTVLDPCSLWRNRLPTCRIS